MRKGILIFSLISLVSFYSCETDIDTNAEYKDMTIVYGLLDPNESDHYIKINKGFIGEGNANDLAGNASNYNYSEGEINVKIDEYKPSGVFVKSYTLSRTVNDIPKDNGVFDNSSNVLYKFTEPNLNKDNTYKLSIYNPSLEKTVSSETEVVAEPSVKGYYEVKLRNQSGVSANFPIEVTPSSNLGRVKVNFVFNYTEFYTNTTDSIDKNIKLSMGEELATNLNGNLLEFSISGDNLFSAIESQIPTNTPNILKRKIRNATVELILAGQDLSTYMSVNDPSIGLANKPDYTNITNGLGIFSSRSTMIVKSLAFPDVGEVGYDGRINLSEYTIKKIITMGREFCSVAPAGSASSTPQNICQ